jgi:hypothetical protein
MRKRRFCHCELPDAAKQSLVVLRNEIASAKDASQ